MYQCLNGAIPSRICSFKAPAKWGSSVYVLTEVYHQRSKWLAPKFFSWNCIAFATWALTTFLLLKSKIWNGTCPSDSDGSVTDLGFSVLRTFKFKNWEMRFFHFYPRNFWAMQCCRFFKVFAAAHSILKNDQKFPKIGGKKIASQKP